MFSMGTQKNHLNDMNLMNIKNMFYVIGMITAWAGTKMSVKNRKAMFIVNTSLLL